MQPPSYNSAGKGDAPRNNSSKAFAENFDAIDWGSTPEVQSNGARKPKKFFKRYGKLA